DPGICLPTSAPCGNLGIELLLAFRRQRRQSAIFRIDDQRRATNRCTAVPPELVIGQREIRILVLRPVISGCATVGLRVEVLFLLFAEQFFFAGGARALERRDRAVVPGALQIRISPGCPGTRPFGGLCRRPVCGRRRLAAGRNGVERGCEQERTAERREDRTAHEAPRRGVSG